MGSMIAYGISKLLSCQTKSKKNAQFITFLSSYTYVYLNNNSTVRNNEVTIVTRKCLISFLVVSDVYLLKIK